MITIKQPPGSGICVIACIAMLTGRTLDEVLSIARLKLCDLTGMHFCPKREELRIFAELGYGTGMSPELDPPTRFSSDDLVEVVSFANIKDVPALLTVYDRSKYFNGYHAVVWDNEAMAIRDPGADVPDVVPLHFYKVKEWQIVREIRELETLEKQKC